MTHGNRGLWENQKEPDRDAGKLMAILVPDNDQQLRPKGHRQPAVPQAVPVLSSSLPLHLTRKLPLNRKMRSRSVCNSTPFAVSLAKTRIG